MPDYRRSYIRGGTFFFALVTENRSRFLCEPDARESLRAAIRNTQGRWPFHLDAIALLPDHLHAIWTLPPGDTNYSRRWAFLKKEFTKGWLAKQGREQPRSESRRRNRRRGVWQRRYWEHTIQEHGDYVAYMDYLLYNCGQARPCPVPA